MNPVLHEIVILTLVFIALALYFDIYSKSIARVILPHVIALSIALLLSKVIYDIIHKN